MNTFLDWSFIKQSLPIYFDAWILTIKISLSAIIVALILGFILSLILRFQIKLFNQLIHGYTTFFRFTPLMLQLFFIFYGLPKIGINISPNFTSFLGLILIGTAYMTVSFNSCLNSVPKQQVDSSYALGFNQFQSLRYILSRQAITYSIPLLGANAIFMIKETSVFSVIAVMDLMNITKTQIGIYYKTNESLFLLIVSYAIIIIPLSWIMRKLEKKIRYAEFGH